MVSERRPPSRPLIAQRLYRFIRGRVNCGLQRLWLFALIALISVFVIATHFLFTLNVKIVPIHSSKIFNRSLIGGHNPTERADQIGNSVLSSGAENRNTVDRAGVEKEFQKQWFRMQRARVDWNAMLVPCGYVNSVKDKTTIGYGKINATSISKSFVEYMEIRPAGQFSRIFIRTRTNDGRNKAIGGDFWMVIFSGPANVPATVFDHNNGSYEAIALLVDPGNYTIIAIIERSLCEGYREPEPSFYAYYMKRRYIWVYKVSEEVDPVPPRRMYVWGRIDNTKIRFHVVRSRDDVEKRLKSVFRHRPCAANCRLIWTGLGRWIGKDWKPYLKTDDHDLDMTRVAKERRQPLESLYIAGDSTNRMFSQEYFHRKQLCHGKKIWKRCTWEQQRIFPLEKTSNPKALKFAERYGNVSERFRFNVILDSIRHAFQTEGMNSSRSLFILHYNTHQTKYLTFAQWKKLIDEVVMMLKNRRRLFGSQAQVVWKTMTAIGYKGAFYQFEGMYHTAFRTRLFAAYALSQMCKAGFEIYDVYPMSASTLIGARDRVHFLYGVFPKAMEALTWWYLSNNKNKTTDICFETA